MTYKVGIVGCGRIAGGFEDLPLTEKPCTHVGAYNAIPETEVVAVADVSEEQVGEFSKRWGIPKAYTDYKKMFEGEELDIVSVCVPDEYHAEVVISAAETCKPKAIFCEKVMATTLEDAKAMVKACKENNVRLIVDYTRRFDPVYQKIKELIDSGKIGEPLFIYGSYISGLEVMGTHVLDLFRFLFGEITGVYGEEEEKALEEMDERYSENYTPKDKPYNGLFHFKSGAVGFLSGTSRRDHEFFEIDIHGTKGRIQFHDTNVIYKEEGNVSYFVKGNDSTNLARESFPSVEGKNLMISAIEEVLECVKSDRKSISSGYDGMCAVELMFALKKSYEKKCMIKLPLEV